MADWLVGLLRSDAGISKTNTLTRKPGNNEYRWHVKTISVVIQKSMCAMLYTLHMCMQSYAKNADFVFIKISTHEHNCSLD